MLPIEQSIDSLISKYNSLTNGCARSRIYENSAWAFLQAGFSEQDLSDVVKWIKLENSRNMDCRYSLDLRKLLGDLERFNDLLSRATSLKAIKRTPAQSVTDSFRGFQGKQDGSTIREIGKILQPMITP